MPPAIKTRKRSTVPNASPRKLRGLDAFTKVSKAITIEKSIVEQKYDTESTAITSKYSTLDRKRKHIEEETTEPPSSKRRDISSSPKTQSQDINQTPQKLTADGSSPVSIDNPTGGARSLLNRFCISLDTSSKSPLSYQCSISSSNSAAVTSSTSPRVQLSSCQYLPKELIDLITLNAAFLTALSIQYAHNGAHSPADLRNLCPDVSRVWGKRRVTSEDVRRVIGVLNAEMPIAKVNHRLCQFSLSNYGHGKICVEIKTIEGNAGQNPRPVNENLLNEIFVRSLKTSWEGRADEGCVKEFIADLPLEPITTCPSLLKLSPLFTKGQRRLEEMKAGFMMKKDTVEQAASTTGMKPSLLERLRAKQLHQKNLPPPPSKAELSRKQALQRIEEVVAVLSILSTSSSIGQQRISFTFPTVLGKLRDSFKNPMSKEEGTNCLWLLATGIAPEWVKVVKMGKVEALVVNREGRPTEEQIRMRVEHAG